MVDDLERLGVDHVHGVALAVGHVHARGIVPHDAAEPARPVLAVDVARIEHGRHPRERPARRRRLARRHRRDTRDGRRGRGRGRRGRSRCGHHPWPARRARAAQRRPGLEHSAIVERAHGGSGHATARELLEAALVESDNTASDLVLRLSGGPAAVMARLREVGLEGIDVSRSEGQSALDYWGVAAPPPAQWKIAMFARLRAQATVAERRAAADRFLSDPRDAATPEAMATLLGRLQRGELLQAETTTLLLDLLARATTGPGRIKALLPRGALVAHKTGTGGDAGGVNCCTNDAGLVTLPDG